MVYYPLPFIPFISLPMSTFPSQPSASPPSNSNGDGPNLQDPILLSAHDAQPSIPTVVDGSRSDCPTQPLSLIHI